MITPQYFGNNGAQLGIVKQYATTTSWAAFIRDLLWNPVILNITRDRYAQLSKKDQHLAKRVPYFTPSAFKSSPCQRVYGNATKAFLIALDIDDPRDAAPFVKTPALLAGALDPHPFAAYLTASSTPTAPRLRVLVSADGISVPRYADAVRTVATLLGLRTVTKESTTVVQPMYRPTLFAEEDPIITHPLIIAQDQGTPFTEGDIRNIDSSGDVEDSPDSPPQSLANVDDLDFLRPTVEGVTLGDAASALKKLDPDMEYPRWLEVAAALKHQFPRPPQSEEAYALFDSWSSQGDKYVSSAETRAKWKSLQVHPKGRAPVTIRTLFHRAKAEGWDSSEVESRSSEELRQWIESPNRTLNELQTQGLRRLAAAMVFNPIARANLFHILKLKLKKFGCNVTATELRQALHRMEKKLPSPDDPAPASMEDTALPIWARGICYVAGANVFYRRESTQRFSPEALDSVFGVHLMQKTDAESMSTGRPTIRPRDYLLNIANIPKVDHFRYAPDQATESFIEENEMRFVNIYRPTYPEGDPTKAKKAGEVITHHLENLISDPVMRRTFMDYLAYQVQFPGKKIRWALLLQGAQGCGKTLIAEMMHAVLGQGNFRYVSADDLFDKYTGWGSGNQLVCMEEVRVIGHNRHDVINKLKPMISNDYNSIRRMREDPVQEPNITNYLLLTNYQDCIAITSEDRRYFVVFSDLQTRKQVLALGGTAYFERIFNQIKTNAAGLRAFWEEWEISPGFAKLAEGPAPRTRFLNSLVQAAASPLQLATQNAITDKLHPLVATDLISLTSLRRVVETDNVGSFTDQQLAAVLRDLGYVSYGRRTIQGFRHALWVQQGVAIREEQIIKTVTERSGAMDLKDL